MLKQFLYFVFQIAKQAYFSLEDVPLFSKKLFDGAFAFNPNLSEVVSFKKKLLVCIYISNLKS